MKHEVDVNDGDLQYLNARYQEGLEESREWRQLVERIYCTASQILAQTLSIKGRILGLPFSIEVKLK